ncbi:MAG: hypothetical protein LBR45_00075 [Bacteroidales bacterium]|jgi:hypothetical protein|nr:hypothetical protein [Bacteroidales bacterium]
MLLKLSKNSAIMGYIMLLILSLVYWIIDVLGANIPFPENSITALLILFGAIIFSVIVHKQNLSKGYIVSAMLLVVICYSDIFFFKDIHLIIQTLIAIIAFSMLLRSHNKSNGYVSLFNGSFLFSTISVFNPQFVLALPFIWIMLIVYGNNNYKDWLISLIAAALPYILLLSFCFIFDRWDYFPLFDLEIILPVWSNALILPIILIFIGILAFVQQMKLLRGDIVYVRNISLFLAAYVYFTLFFVLFYTYDASHIMFPVLYAFIIGKYLNAMRRKWLAEVLFFLLIVGVAVF